MPSSGTGTFLGRIFYPVSRTMSNIGMVVLLMLMLLITADVLLRYLFNRPILGTFDIVELMLGIVIFFIQSLNFLFSRSRWAKKDMASCWMTAG